MGRFIIQTIPEWRGHNGDSNPVALAPGEIYDDLNCYLRGEALGTRPGVAYDEDYDADFSPGGGVQVVHEARDDFDTVKNRVVIANGRFYVLGTGTAGVVPVELNTGTAALTITAGADNQWTTAQHKDAVYFAGGTTGDEALFKWTIQDESTASGSLNDPASVTITGTSARPKFVFQKWNRLWLSGFGGSDADDNPMIGRFSSLGDGDDWPEANTIGGVSAVGGFSSSGEEYATGWGQYTDNNGDWLLYLSNRRIYSVARTGEVLGPFAKSDEIGVGCVSQRAFVDLGVDFGDAIWVSERGVHSIRQSQQHGGKESTFLSEKVREYFNDLNRNRAEHIVAGYCPRAEIMLVALSTGSNTTHDTILMLDMQNHARGQEDLNADTAKWYVWQLAGGIHANVMAPGRNADNHPCLIIGTAEGDVAMLSDTSYTDLGATYEVRWKTKDDDLGAPGFNKIPGRVFVRLQPGGDYTPLMRLRYNYGSQNTSAIPLQMSTSGAQWNQVNWNQFQWAASTETFREVVRPYGSGETIGFEFRHSANNEPFWIAHLSYQVAGRGVDIGEAD